MLLPYFSRSLSLFLSLSLSMSLSLLLSVYMRCTCVLACIQIRSTQHTDLEDTCHSTNLIHHWRELVENSRYPHTYSCMWKGLVFGMAVKNKLFVCFPGSTNGFENNNKLNPIQKNIFNRKNTVGTIPKYTESLLTGLDGSTPKI